MAARGRSREEHGSAVEAWGAASQPTTARRVATMSWTQTPRFVRLPESVKVTGLDGLSVWCSDVDVSFGDVAFR